MGENWLNVGTHFLFTSLDTRTCGQPSSPKVSRSSAARWNSNRTAAAGWRTGAVENRAGERKLSSQQMVYSELLPWTCLRSGRGIHAVPAMLFADRISAKCDLGEENTTANSKHDHEEAKFTLSKPGYISPPDIMALKLEHVYRPVVLLTTNLKNDTYTLIITKFFQSWRFRLLLCKIKLIYNTIRCCDWSSEKKYIYITATFISLSTNSIPIFLIMIVFPD